ncbi:TPA: sugar kinase [Streptococcus pneumoniae]|uniref:sugar kinase n=1 Tax=Streptococcus pneumoniae TaxID=1313 RepID=UPI000152E8F3|nr:sugar kinase [Streptococcus pneumoniae]EDK64346.1 keto-hydroxyglutarate-aldolase/keto-deoxy-phosphogluconate aldolase [Streptococcus pneumoniae SP11-BS70]VTQ36733.1 2-keto-3-deoxygluconate kinase [Haemophilus haemolyticus]ADM83943.1 Sugar kinase, ribokinase family [Streptococcus pneumoniae AP200]EJH26098.1 pfkB carbohydrate kinase family protein [Streptococcus pneumoniae GA47562]MBW5043314.1 sugar kinase [Streptococcus pneumoniae]
MTKILLFGEPLIRISPLDATSIGDHVASSTYFGGSEINIACNLQALGISTKVFTALPANEIGDRFLTFLKQHQIDTSSICRLGDRIGLYYLENGFGCRQSEVFYDRKHTSISQIRPNMLDMDSLFQGISHFHFSGITVAIGQEVRAILLLLLEEAKRRGIVVSMDLNLRTKMISVLEAKYEFSKFARFTDYCFGIDPLMIDDQNLEMFPRDSASLEKVENRMRLLKEAYGFKAIFHTLRSSDEQDKNVYQAYALEERFEESVQLKTAVYQRIGSGDAFISGALYQLLHHSSLKTTIDFAVASATLKCTLPGDHLSTSATSIENLLANAQDIIR